MSKKSVLDSLRVASPCNEDWERMKGNNTVRFCSHCAKDVNNISEMTPKEAIRLARRSNGNICIRYKVDPATKGPIFSSRLHQLTRSPIAATGVVAASLALSSAVYSQGELRPRVEMPVAYVETDGEAGRQKPEPNAGYGSLSGTVTDDQEARLPGAMVKITNSKTLEFVETATDGEGRFEFKNVPQGTYTINGTFSQNYYNGTIENVSVNEGRETVRDLGLIPLTYTTVGGAVSIVVEYKNALTSAVSNEDIDSVRDLIAAGEDVNAEEEDKTTPLFVAVENGYLEIAAELIDFGAKLNVRNDEGRTPLMALDGDASPELVKLLIGSGAKVNMTDDDGNTALMRAADNQANAEVLKALIDAGADVHITNKAGRSALMVAAYNDDVENVRVLLLAGAKVDLKDEDGDTAWDLTDETEIEKLLLSYGAVPTEGKPDYPVDEHEDTEDESEED